jgi:hypothetical protein
VLMVKPVQPKNDVKKPVCCVTQRMKVGKTETERDRLPPEQTVTTLRDTKSCRLWVEHNGKKDHLYTIYNNGNLDGRWHFHKGNWLKALREPNGMVKGLCIP